MTAQDTLFTQIEKVQDFAFDAQVAQVFDDMVSRSVPFYQEIQRLQADLITTFLANEQQAVICDLGCSTGTSIAYLLSHVACPKDTQFIGIDNSEPMLEQAKIKLTEALNAGRVRLQQADLSELTQLPTANAIIINWALQFIRPIGREALLKLVYQALKPGGILLLSEKILASDTVLNRLYIDHYLHFKKSHSGYTDVENQRKREALENVLVPYRLDENMELLSRAGFKHKDVYFQWFNFACLIAVKK